MKVHSELPDSNTAFREHELAMQLVAMDIPDLHAWFNVSWIPGVGEIDIILWHKRLGLFALEVKGVNSRDIHELSYNSYKLAYHQKATRSPQISLLQRVHELRNQIRGLTHGPLPFITPVVVWSRVSSQEWNSRFESPTRELRHRLLLQDDLFSGQAVFESALKRVQANPIIGHPCETCTLDDDRILRGFIGAIGGNGVVRPLRSDVERLLLLESKVTRQALPDAPVGQPSRVIYTGPPGTGKTFRLLQLGAAHARSSNSVLFVCYNKVLASEVKRLFSQNSSLTTEDNAPWVFDVADLLRLLARSFKVELSNASAGDLSEWYPIITDQLKSAVEPLKFDLVLIDEVQDMNEQMLDFLTQLVATEGSLAVAAGVGQNLYGESSDWLTNFAVNAKLVTLSRNFRNTAPIYRVAASMGRWASAVTELDGGSWNVKEAKFDRNTGRPPVIKMLLDSPRGNAWSPFVHQQTMVEEYRRLVESELLEMHESDFPNDLLILVPTDTSDERFYVTEALERLGVMYLDLTRTKSNTQSWRPFMDERRRSRSSEAIRLCTYRSSRGIEGSRVLIFGLERSLQVARSLDAEPGALLHIVLSRSVADCSVAIPSSATSIERGAIEDCLKNAGRLGKI